MHGRELLFSTVLSLRGFCSVVLAEFENAGLNYSIRKERGVVLRLRKNELKDNQELVTRFLNTAIKESQAG